MKELLKKIWAKMLQHKVWSIILSVILVVSILTTSFFIIFEKTPTVN